MHLQVYDHRSGLKIIPREMLEKIKSVFLHYENKLTKNNSSVAKEELKQRLLMEGWSGEFRLDTDSRITITSFQNNTGLCFQTGNVGRVYADLLKLQTLFVKGKISAGIIIIPMKALIKVFGSNCANYERLVKELPIFKQVITTPLAVIGFNEMEG